MSGLYTAASGLMSNIRKIETHGNNIANAATAGYKKEQETFKVFDETYKRAFTETGSEQIGRYHDQVYVDEINVHFEEGTAQATSRQYDFMLSDAGKDSVSFFVVKQGENEYLTRNGGFTLDADRRLVTENGALVMDQNNQAITLPEGVPFSVNSEGVVINNETNEEIATMRLQSVADQDLQLLQKKQGGFYEVMSFNQIERTFGSMEQVRAQFATNPTIQSVFGSLERIDAIRQEGEVNILTPFEGTLHASMLESSNVTLADEITGLLIAQKGVSSSQKVSTVMDKIFEKEANGIGK